MKNQLSNTKALKGYDVHAKILAKAILSIYSDRKDIKSLIKLVYNN